MKNHLQFFGFFLLLESWLSTAGYIFDEQDLKLFDDTGKGWQEFQEVDLRHSEKRRDAIIGTEYWGKRKKSGPCSWLIETKRRNCYYLFF